MTQNTIDSTIKTLLDFLKAHYTTTGGFDERTFYGESFTAASLALLAIESKWQDNLQKSFFSRIAATSDTHPEFNYYAWQHLPSSKQNTHLQEYLKRPIFNQLFVRKVSNWVLLRALVRVKTQKKLQVTTGLMQALSVVALNTSNGFITDNTLRSIHKKKSSISSQYHAFATLLLGEIYLSTQITYFKIKFLEGLEVSLSEVTAHGEFIMKGRGEKQIFGYASLLYSLSLGYSLIKDERYLQTFEKVFTFLQPYFLKREGIDFILSESMRDRYTYSYNNLLDYIPFFLFYLVKSKLLFESSGYGD